MGCWDTEHTLRTGRDLREKGTRDKDGGEGSARGDPVPDWGTEEKRPPRALFHHFPFAVSSRSRLPRPGPAPLRGYLHEKASGGRSPMVARHGTAQAGNR